MSWLDALAESGPAPRPAPAASRAALPAGHARHEGRAGDHFNARADWADILLPLGAVLHHEAGGVRYWTRPGKDRRDGHSATTGYADDADRLKVFTPHWPPFADGEVYTKFGAYALLNHGGDYQAAARELSRTGYGSQQPAAPAGDDEVPWPDEQAPHPADAARAATPGRQLGKVPAAAPQAPFPVPDEAMFYGLAGEIVNSVDSCTEASRPAVLIHLLAGAGAMIGRGPHMYVGFADHPASVWALVVGGTSIGAKGTADATARAFLRAADRDFITSRTLPALSTGEGLIHQVRDDSEATDKEGRPLEEGVNDKRLYVVLPEFRTVMAQARRETNTLSATLRLAWDSPSVLSVPNRNAPYKATDAHIVMVAHVTPGEFRARMDPAEIAGGLLNRYLIIASRTSKDLPNEPSYPEEDQIIFGKRLRAAIDAAHKLGYKRIIMTAAARDLWDENYRVLKNPTGARSEDEEGVLASVVVRARPHVLRVALTYALLDCSQIVDERHLVPALALWRYSLDSARWLFRTASPDLDKLRAFIDDADPSGRSKEQVRSDLFGRHLKADEIDRLLSQLGVDYEEYSEPTKGRPRTVYRRRPGAERAKGAESQ